MCEEVGKGMCSHGHYFNMFKMYYCYLNQSRSLYYIFVFVFFTYMMLSLNFIRRTYFIQHIQRLRKIMSLPDFVAESILVPVSYGIVPIFIRILSSVNKVDFSFQTGSNIGACFNLTTLFTGVCAMKIGMSPKIDLPMFKLNMIFVFIGNLLHLPLGSRKVVNHIDALLYFGMFGVYMMCRLILARKRQTTDDRTKKIASIEGKLETETATNLY